MRHRNLIAQTLHTTKTTERALDEGVEDENADPVGDGHSDVDFAAAHPKPRGPAPGDYSPEPDSPAPPEPLEPDGSDGGSPDDDGDLVPRRGVKR